MGKTNYCEKVFDEGYVVIWTPLISSNFDSCGVKIISTEKEALAQKKKLERKKMVCETIKFIDAFRYIKGGKKLFPFLKKLDDEYGGGLYG